jgi:cytochrome P450
MFRILQNVDVEDRILEEIQACVVEESSQPSISSLGNAPLLNSAWKETLRLRRLGPTARVPRQTDYTLSEK